MELGLSLGDASKSLGFSGEKNSPNLQHRNPSVDFCISLGLASNNHQEIRGKRQKSTESGGEEDDDDGLSASDDDNQGGSGIGAPLQLNLLPLAPVPRQIHSRLWSSDNGSSENGSSGNTAAAKGLDVNRLPAAGEVSSANSVGYRKQQLGGAKRDFDAAAAEAERGSDDDENGLNTRKKLRLSKEQSAFLEESFKEHNTLNPKQKLALAKQLNLRARQVEVWFQNRRARTKLKQTEVDCEYLKRCCETLTQENTRLHKEVQELRTLKTSNPFYMQLPATTLTMCPSCAVAPPAAAVVDSSPANPFPLARPRLYPFSQTPTHPNQPAPS